MRLDGPQDRSGWVRKNSPPTWIRTPDLPTHSESLYRLRYPGPIVYMYIYIYIYVVYLLIINCTRCTVHTPQLNYKCHLLLKHSFRTICNCAYIGLLTSPGVASVTARDLRLPPRCGCDLPSSWVLRCVISQKGAELNMSLRHIIFIVTCLFRVHLNAIQHYIRDV